MVCAACLVAPVLLLTGVSSVYYNTLLGLIITIIFCLIYLYINQKNQQNKQNNKKNKQSNVKDEKN